MKRNALKNTLFRSAFLARRLRQGQLAPQHYRALAAPEHYSAAGGVLITIYAPLHPASPPPSHQARCLRSFRRNAKAKQVQADQAEAARQAAEELRLCNLPRDLLASARLRGVVLGLTADGKHITVLPAPCAPLQPSEIDTIKERATDFFALLKAEAAAAAPIVIV